MKNAVYAGIIAVCLLLAVLAYVFLWGNGGSGGGIKDIGAGETQWVICLNKNCGAAYEMSKRDFVEQSREAARANPLQQIFAVKCEKCGQKSAVKAIKCPKCGEVFLYGTLSNPDRCPKCNYSETEAIRKERLGQQ